MALGEYLLVMFGLISLLGMLGLAVVLARKAGLIAIPNMSGQNRRLSIVETMALDGRRRVVVIRHGDREHLVLLGAQTETLIEAGLPIDELDTLPAPDALKDTPTTNANPFAAFVKAHANRSKDAA